MDIRKIIIFLVIIAATLTTLLFLRDGVPWNHKVVLWSDNPDLISYVEIFNSKHDNLKIETIYKKDPAMEIKISKRKPDIVFASYLNSPQVIDNFINLNQLFGKNKLDKSSFYEKLLTEGKALKGNKTKSKKQSLLPVSFNMPALMFRSGDVSNNISSFFLTDENIAELSKDFNKENPKGLAFSPRWNSNILYHNIILNSNGFMHENKKLIYDAKAIEDSLESVRTFLKNNNGGLENDKAFEIKHLYKPDENLIEERRIFFAYTDLRDFYAIGAQKRNQLNFRWLSNKQTIPVSDDVIYAGIPKGAANKRGAKAFLKWFFTHEAQEEMMEAGKTKRIRTFGLCGGFSSIQSINGQVFPRHYPLLVGHIPPEEMLSFPPPRPIEWEMLKKNVIKKWLYFEAGNETTTTSLDSAVSDWYKVNPGF